MRGSHLTILTGLLIIGAPQAAVAQDGAAKLVDAARGQSSRRQPGDLDYLAGDIARRLHIGIVSDRRSPQTGNPLIIHNIGLGTQKEDIPFALRLPGIFAISADYTAKQDAPRLGSAPSPARQRF